MPVSLAKNTSDRSPSDISVLAMEQIGLRGHKRDPRDGRNRDVTHRCMPQISICRSPETEPPEPLETRTLVVRRIFDEGQPPYPAPVGAISIESPVRRADG